jgi:hypothetical protein
VQLYTPASDPNTTNPGEKVLAAWIERFNARALDEICLLYSGQAVLWGTYATEPITEPAGIRRYFSSAFGQGLLVSLVHAQLHTQSFSSFYVCSGAYVVAKGSLPGAAASPARFTVVVGRERDSWRIVNHHSSLNPAALSSGA